MAGRTLRPHGAAGHNCARYLDGSRLQSFTPSGLLASGSTARASVGAGAGALLLFSSNSFKVGFASASRSVSPDVVAMSGCGGGVAGGTLARLFRIISATRRLFSAINSLRVGDNGGMLRTDSASFHAGTPSIIAGAGRDQKLFNKVVIALIAGRPSPSRTLLSGARRARRQSGDDRENL